MLDDRTYEKILAEVLADAPPGIDVRPGSIYYDAVAGVCFKLASYYTDLRHVFDLVFLATAVDSYLDQKGEEYGIERNEAVPARYEYLYDGVFPAADSRFFYDGLYFILKVESDSYYLEAENAGISGNDILPNTPAVPANNIDGLKASSFGKRIRLGTDTENDEDYRQRIREKLSGHSENGNRSHYKTWCEGESGVGRARIVPLFAGPNTVMGVIIGTDGTPADSDVVERVQNYIDPITLNKKVEYNGELIPIGDGLGNGVANIGAHFAAVQAEEKEISVSFSLELASGSGNIVGKDKIIEDANNAIREYFKKIALDIPENEDAVVRINDVGAIILGLRSDIDYKNLKLNSSASNIKLTCLQVPVLKKGGVLLEDL